MAEYHETLRELGIEEDDLQFASSSDHGTFQLTEKYISRVEATLIAWFTNILEVWLMPHKVNLMPCTIYLLLLTVGSTHDETPLAEFVFYNMASDP